MGNGVLTEEGKEDELIMFISISDLYNVFVFQKNYERVKVNEVWC